MMLCEDCVRYTQTIEPICIRKQTFQCFEVRGLCADCFGTKSKILAATELRRLPEFWKAIPIKRAFLKYVKIKGKCYELFPVLDKIINC